MFAEGLSALSCNFRLQHVDAMTLTVFVVQKSQRGITSGECGRLGELNFRVQQVVHVWQFRPNIFWPL